MLNLYSSSNLRALAEQLAATIQTQPADPMTPEWIAVGSPAMGRWLKLELAKHLGASGPTTTDGIAANVTLALPGALRTALLTADAGPDDIDPWSVELLVWPILATLDGTEAGVQLAAVRDAANSRSRYGVSRRIADLFDRYHVHRPEMVRHWAAGRDVDGTGRALTDAQRWQPVLWRLVNDRITQPSPAHRLVELLDRAASPSIPMTLQSHNRRLPHRLTFFGLTMLPAGPGFVDVASALSGRHEINLYLVDASPALAAKLAQSLEPATTVRYRTDDHTDLLVDHTGYQLSSTCRAKTT